MGKLCGDPNCKASSDMNGDPTFGKGELDDWGYWEEPCSICARKWEELNPGQIAWPHKWNKE